MSLPRGRFNQRPLTWARAHAGSHFIYKVTSEEAAGRFALLEGTFAPRMLIPPHVHTREDEISIVIHGRLGARVGDVEYELGPGGVLLKPRNIVHSLWNPTDGLTVVLEHISPGAYVHFFEDVGAVVRTSKGDVRKLHADGTAARR